jgi:putative flippase GtrA
MIRKIKALYQKYRKGFWHFVKFQCVGVVNFFVDLGVFTLLHTVIGFYAVPSNIVSYSCGIVNSFILNRYWTFKIKLKFFSIDFLKFLLVNLVSLGINTLAIYVLVDLYNLDPTLSKVIATAFSFTVNFAGNKLLVFREDKQKKQAEPVEEPKDDNRQ